MEKRSSRSKAPPPPEKKLPRERVFGGNTVKLSEDDASKLIGSIVEKGIYENKPVAPSSAPRPTVLPFPIARHRSHGPHWAPKVGKCHSISGVDDDDDNEDDYDATNYDPVADFADPIKRKKKKGLDLSYWRELIPSNNFPTSHKNEEGRSMTSGRVMQNINEEAVEISYANGKYDKLSPAAKSDRLSTIRLSEPLSTDEKGIAVDSGTVSVGTMGLERVDILSTTAAKSDAGFKPGHDWLDGTQCDSASCGGDQLRRVSFNDGDIRMDESTPSKKTLMSETQTSSFLSSGSTFDDGYQSLESQIDAENRALLQKMSADEIAEAQAEIKSKINPKLLEILKKRSKEKVDRQKRPGLDSALNNGFGFDDMQVDERLNQDEKGSAVPASSTPSLGLTACQNSKVRLDDSAVQNCRPSVSHLWNAWSKRVEAVRELRFSLDGDVVKTDFFHTSEVGKNLDQSGYSADNVAERDFLRTEGDPGAAGYTIKEALALARSVVPAQRALALHLLSSVLNKALLNIHCNPVGRSMITTDNAKNFIDWEAIWAFSLGPEPELVLSLRMTLDDNHNSVVLACAKVIECILASDANEEFFDMSEKVPAHVKDQYTAPVFRARSEINLGFLHGGFWKYSTKPSNTLPFDEDTTEENTEGGRTIKDDNVVAGQDISAGFIRMGILPRLRFLLETGPTLALEESILSILIAMARASPACSSAIMKCHGIINIVVERFMMQEKLKVQAAQIKSVTLLRVLAQSDKSSCEQFIRDGIFQKLTWQLHCITSSVDGWIKCGREHCKLASKLMVEQLRLWRVCVNYGHCVYYFTAVFPTLCLWLNPPTFEKLIEKNLLREFSSTSSEAYLVLEALARRLPDLNSQQNTISEFQDTCGDGGESWCWSDVAPMVDLALKWIAFSSDSSLSMVFDLQTGTDGKSFIKYEHVSSLMWVITAVMHMLSTILTKAAPKNLLDHESIGIRRPLPEFIAKIGYQIVKNGFLSSSHGSVGEFSGGANGGISFIDRLCHFRNQSDNEAALASVCCLDEIVQVIVSTDHLIQLAKGKDEPFSSRYFNSSTEGRTIGDGILKSSVSQWRLVLHEFMKLVESKWHFVQSIEVFGRGGPAPGVGLGWGASGGGFWSSTVFLAQADARLLIDLVQTVYSSSNLEPPADSEGTFLKHMIATALAVCLIAGPSDGDIVKKALDVLLQIPVLKFLSLCIHQFSLNFQGIPQFKLEYSDDNLVRFSKLLSSHFSKRWLCVKQKKPKEKDGFSSPGHKTLQNSDGSLETIPEEIDMDAPPMTNVAPISMAVEWAHQRLPLPNHWLLSPFTTLGGSEDGKAPSASGKTLPVQDSMEPLEVSRAGLFFLLGIEVMSANMSDEDLPPVHSPVTNIPLVWKLHSLSVVLLSDMAVLEEDRARYVYDALQTLYGKQLDEFRLNSGTTMDFLRFQSEINETYATFIDSLVEKFASESFGDLLYGRQIAIYLHRQVEAPIRLAVWNALSISHVIELLPPLDECTADAAGYLEPVEEEDSVLEAYVKSWVSGALDRAVTRGSMTYTLVVHHLSSFIFNAFSRDAGQKLSLRNKLVKSLLRDYSRKQQHKAMMLDLVQHNLDCTIERLGQYGDLDSKADELNRRLELLAVSCEGNSSLLNEVEKLKSLVQINPSG
ncbi:hypothetical protein Dimus_002781 [Dionaea muscipula]